MTAQSWIVLGAVVLAALFFCRQAFRSLFRKTGGSGCEACSSSCAERVVTIKPHEKRPENRKMPPLC